MSLSLVPDLIFVLVPYLGMKGKVPSYSRIW